MSSCGDQSHSSFQFWLRTIVSVPRIYRMKVMSDPQMSPLNTLCPEHQSSGPRAYSGGHSAQHDLAFTRVAGVEGKQILLKFLCKAPLSATHAPNRGSLNGNGFTMEFKFSEHSLHSSSC